MHPKLYNKLPNALKNILLFILPQQCMSMTHSTFSSTLGVASLFTFCQPAKVSSGAFSEAGEHSHTHTYMHTHTHPFYLSLWQHTLSNYNCSLQTQWLHISHDFFTNQNNTLSTDTNNNVMNIFLHWYLGFNHFFSQNS